VAIPSFALAGYPEIKGGATDNPTAIRGRIRDLAKKKLDP